MAQSEGPSSTPGTASNRTTAGTPSHQTASERTAGTASHQTASERTAETASHQTASERTAETASHQLILRAVAVAGLLLAVAAFASGCRSKECARMMACCQQVKDVDGMGEACGPQANAVEDPKTCKTILETIGYMFDEKEKELPEVCKIEDSE